MMMFRTTCIMVVGSLALFGLAMIYILMDIRSNPLAALHWYNLFRRLFE